MSHRVRPTHKKVLLLQAQLEDFLLWSENFPRSIQTIGVTCGAGRG